MSIHIWCPRASTSAVFLRDSIRNYGVTCHKSKPNMTERGVRHFLSRVKDGDLWVNWGNANLNFRDLANVRLKGRLNNVTPINKRTQLVQLAVAGVPVPEVYDGPGDGRIGRSFNHAGGHDILRGTGRDYWTQRLNLDYEFRVHVFRGRSIRAGMKVKRTPDAHEWIRSYDAGWSLDYGTRCQDVISDRVRDAARKAVEVLHLDFGAVDVGLVHGVRPRNPVVLEVNTAPGLDPGPSVDAYVRHILDVYRG